MGCCRRKGNKDRSGKRLKRKEDLLLNWRKAEEGLRGRNGEFEGEGLVWEAEDRRDC